ncbi:MAG: hypothetical protein M0D55_03130 [Elusimicrobiota bacterium]|nr:MAG: hypothetical protein M0D55_03130 [Elusimicrobiota bacterium]
MNRAAAVLAAAAMCGACADLPRKAAVEVADRWSPPSAAAAKRLIELYGPPDDAQLNRLTWNRKGPWLRTAVWNRPQVYRSPRDFDLVEQTVRYPVSREKAAELVAFSGALLVDVAKGEMSSRASREEVNFLNLNLADEVVRGRKTVDEARVAYKRILELTAAGKSSAYVGGLRFDGKGAP